MEKPRPFTLAVFASSVINKATWAGCAGITGTSIFDNAQVRHFNQAARYLRTVEDALAPSCSFIMFGIKFLRERSASVFSDIHESVLGCSRLIANRYLTSGLSQHKMRLNLAKL